MKFRHLWQQKIHYLYLVLEITPLGPCWTNWIKSTILRTLFLRLILILFFHLLLVLFPPGFSTNTLYFLWVWISLLFQTNLLVISIDMNRHTKRGNFDHCFLGRDTRSRLDMYRRFGGSCCLHLLPWRWRYKFFQNVGTYWPQSS
jgi:hypothetical protein